MKERESSEDVLAYRRGLVDFLANAPSPYPRGTRAYRAWISGWQNSRLSAEKSHVVAIRVPRDIGKH